MKKYFLLIALSTIVFLWLGNNYSFACNASAIAAYVSCVAANNWELGSCVQPSDVVGCIQAECPASCGIFNPSNWMCVLDCVTVSPPPSTDPTVAERNTRCNVTTITTANFSNVTQKTPESTCCTTVDWDPSGIRACTDQDLFEWEACIPAKANAHANGLGSCVCNAWYKNVNRVCTSCKTAWVCCGIQLNTSIPFIGKCIEEKGNQWSDETGVTWTTAFPTLMWSLTKILVTVILIISFVLIIIGGIMIATGNPSWGKKMIINVVIGIALLGASGVILRLINPNFFG